MKYYSEVTKKLYDSEDAVKTAEENLKKIEAIKEAEEKKKKAERAARAKEVEDAFKAATEARDKANKLLSAFTKDYGYFHMSYTNNDKAPKTSLVDLLFDFI